MNITIVTILLPYPLTSGGAQAQYNFIDQLRKRHRISVIFPENGMNTISAMNTLKKLWPEVEFFPYPYLKQLSNPIFFLSKVRRAVCLKLFKNKKWFKQERILDNYGFDLSDNFILHINNVLDLCNSDILQVEFYPFLAVAKKIDRDIKKIFIHHEIRFMRNERMLKDLGVEEDGWMDFYRHKQDEINDLNTYDKVVTLTDTDKDILMKEGVNKEVTSSPAAIGTKNSKPVECNNGILFLGAYFHAPNQEAMKWMCDEVLPIVASKYNHLTFNIIGKGWEISHLQNIKGIDYRLHGFVPDLEDIAKGCIMVVPILSGSGMRMKILEGAALGTPIITTSIGVEGLLFINEHSCIIADSAEQFANAIVQLLTTPHKCRMLTYNAQKVFECNYSISALTTIRENVYLN